MRRIVTAAIRYEFGMGVASATFDDGSTRPDVVRWYSDEITFSVPELIGKTEAEVTKMHYEKDLRYLRS